VSESSGNEYLISLPETAREDITGRRASGCSSSSPARTESPLIGSTLASACGEKSLNRVVGGMKLFQSRLATKSARIPLFESGVASTLRQGTSGISGNRRSRCVEEARCCAAQACAPQACRIGRRRMGFSLENQVCAFRKAGGVKPRWRVVQRGVKLGRACETEGGPSISSTKKNGLSRT